MRIARSMGVRLSESLDLSFLEPARPEFARGALFFESPRAARDVGDSVRRTLEQLAAISTAEEFSEGVQA